VGDAIIDFLYLQGDWSYRELDCTFNYDHKTVKRDLAPLNLFLSGNPTPEGPTPEEASGPLCHLIELHFIFYFVVAASDIRGARILACPVLSSPVKKFDIQKCFQRFSDY
jgi:hypothetical protein